MPDASAIIGKVAVKVIPDTSEFKDKLKAELEKIEKSTKDLKVKLQPVIDSTQAAREAKKAQATAQAAVKGVKLKVNLDEQSDIESALAKVRQRIVELGRKKEIDLSLNVGALRAVEQGLKKALAKVAKISLSVDENSQDSVRSAIAAIEQQMAKLKETQLEVHLDEGSLDVQLQRLKAKLRDIETVELRVDTADTTSLTRAINELKAKIAEKIEVVVPVKVNGGELEDKLAEYEAKLAELNAKRTIDLGVHLQQSDIAKLEAALSAIEAEMEALHGFSLPVEVNEASLAKAKAEIKAALLDRNRLELKVGANEKSLRAAIAKVDAEIDKLKPADLRVRLDADSLQKARAGLLRDLDVQLQASINVSTMQLRRVQQQMSKLRFAPAIDRKKLAAAKREVEGMLLALDEKEAKLGLELDPVAKRKLELEIAALKERIQATVKPELDSKAFAATRAALKALGKVRKVVIRPVLDNAATRRVGQALAMLSGGSLVADKFRAIGSILDGFDKYVPKIAAVGTAIVGLGGFAAASTANFVSLAGSIASIGLAGFAVPGILGGFAVGLGITAAALKDFNDRLPGVKKELSALQDIISDRFWTVAQAPFERLADKTFPLLKREAGDTSRVLGEFFGRFATQLGDRLLPRLPGMFENLRESIRDAMAGTDGMANSIAILGTVGSKQLPRLAQFFADKSNTFSAWLAESEADGSLEEMINTGIQAMVDFGNVLKAVFDIFKGLFDAASAGAGGSVLGTLRTALEKIAEVINSPAFQVGLTGFFRAAFDMMEKITSIAGPAFQTMLLTLGKTFEAIAPIVGETIGLLVKSLSEALANPALQTAIVTLFEAIGEAVVILAPVFDVLASALAAVMPLVNVLLVLFADIVAALASSLVPILQALIPPFVGIAQVLGDAMLKVLEALEPVIVELAGAFASFLSSGLLPALIDLTAQLIPVLEKVLPLIGQAFTDALVALTPVLPVLVTAFGDLVAALLPLVPVLLDSIVPILPSLAQLFANLVTSLTPLVTSIVGGLPGVVTAFGELVTAAMELWDVLSPVLIPVLQFLAFIFLTTVQTAIEGVANILSGLAGIIGGVVDFIAGVFTLDWGRAWEGIKSIFTGILELIIGALQLFFSVTILKPFAVGFGFIKGLWTGGWNGIKTFLDDIWTKLTGVVSTGISSVVGFFRNLPGNIVRSLGDLGSTLLGHGRRLLEGLWAGIQAAATWLKDLVLNFFGSILPGWVKDILGIHSPSRVFAEFGVFVTEGFGNGIADATAMSGVNSAAQALADAAIAPMDTSVLFDTGTQIVDGLLNGLESRYDAVTDSLKGLAKDVAGTDMGTLAVPTFGGLSAVSDLATGMGQSTVNNNRTLNYYAAAGQSFSTEDDLFSAASRTRMVW